MPNLTSQDASATVEVNDHRLRAHHLYQVREVLLTLMTNCRSCQRIYAVLMLWHADLPKHAEKQANTPARVDAGSLGALTSRMHDCRSHRVFLCRFHPCQLLDLSVQDRPV